METVSPFALTTLQRCKDLLFDPSLTIQVTGTTASGSNLISNAVVPSGKTVRIGQTISGPGIPLSAAVTAIAPNSLTLSQNATAAATGVALTVIDQPVAFDAVLTRMINSCSGYLCQECGRTSFVQQTFVNDTYSIDAGAQDALILRNAPVFEITSFQWRAGTPTNPSWTDFIPDQYELMNPQTDPASGFVWYPSGMVRVYGTLPRLYSNMIRATYVAGYPVDWPNAGSGVTHLLPPDLTATCENLVVRRFKRRQLAGMSAQGLEGATHSWRTEIDAEDLDVTGQYRLMHF